MSVPPDKPQPRITQPLRDHHTRISRAGIISLLILIGFLLTLFTGMLIYSVTPQAQQAASTAATATASSRQVHQSALSPSTPTATANPGVTPTPTPPIFTPNNTTIAPLQMPDGHYVIFEQQNNMYLVPLNSGLPQHVNVPNYAYNQAVRPLLTPSGQILYSGDGLWLTDVFGGLPTQVATIGPNTVITSMALSNDGKMLAWSTEPTDGQGMIDIFAGPITNPVQVYEQSTANCPCFRVFALLNSAGKQGGTSLLLTDTRGSLEAVQSGLWSLDIGSLLAPAPTQLLSEEPQQGPLLLSPSGKTLLYSTNEGQVPFPTDNSVPTDIASLTYANSLTVAPIGGQPPALGSAQTVLPEQHNLHSISDYHWVTTPVFTPDERTLVYVEFSSDEQPPYDRHSAIYTAQIVGSKGHLQVGTPKLLATTTASLVELGSWLNDHVLSFYSDGMLYAIDIQTGAVATLFQTRAYARIVAIVGTGQV